VDEGGRIEDAVAAAAAAVGATSAQAAQHSADVALLPDGRGFSRLGKQLPDHRTTTRLYRRSWTACWSDRLSGKQATDW